MMTCMMMKTPKEGIVADDDDECDGVTFFAYVRVQHSFHFLKMKRMTIVKRELYCYYSVIPIVQNTTPIRCKMKLSAGSAHYMTNMVLI